MNEIPKIRIIIKAGFRGLQLLNYDNTHIIKHLPSKTTRHSWFISASHTMHYRPMTDCTYLPKREIRRTPHSWLVYETSYTFISILRGVNIKGEDFQVNKFNLLTYE